MFFFNIKSGLYSRCDVNCGSWIRNRANTWMLGVLFLISPDKNILLNLRCKVLFRYICLCTAVCSITSPPLFHTLHLSVFSWAATLYFYVCWRQVEAHTLPCLFNTQSLFLRLRYRCRLLMLTLTQIVSMRFVDASTNHILKNWVNFVLGTAPECPVDHVPMNTCFLAVSSIPESKLIMLVNLPLIESAYQKTQDVHPMLSQWWASVADVVPALKQHRVNVSCLLGFHQWACLSATLLIKKIVGDRLVSWLNGLSYYYMH